MGCRPRGVFRPRGEHAARVVEILKEPGQRLVDPAAPRGAEESDPWVIALAEGISATPPTLWDQQVGVVVSEPRPAASAPFASSARWSTSTSPRYCTPKASPSGLLLHASLSCQIRWLVPRTGIAETVRRTPTERSYSGSVRPNPADSGSLQGTNEGTDPEFGIAGITGDGPRFGTTNAPDRPPRHGRRARAGCRLARLM